MRRRSRRVTLARPQARNAQTPSTWRALTAVGAALGPDVRVVVLDAEGPSFSAGLDRRMLDGTGGPSDRPSLADLAALDAPALDRTLAGFQAAFTWWRRSSAVTVAAVAGHAVGAGFQLALACDLIVCAEDALFAMREVSLGLVPDLGDRPRRGRRRVSTRPGDLRVGRWVGAREAVDLGLAVAAVPSGELAAAVDDLTAALLAAPADALRETAQLIRDAVGRSEDANPARARRRAAGWRNWPVQPEADCGRKPPVRALGRAASAVGRSTGEVGPCRWGIWVATWPPGRTHATAA